MGIFDFFAADSQLNTKSFATDCTENTENTGNVIPNEAAEILCYRLFARNEKSHTTNLSA
jgi:hypothetical protein